MGEDLLDGEVTVDILTTTVVAVIPDPQGRLSDPQGHLDHPEDTPVLRQSQYRRSCLSKQSPIGETTPCSRLGHNGLPGFPNTWLHSELTGSIT